MKLRIEDCYYELVKDLLLSQDSLVSKVEKDGKDVIVTLRKDKGQLELIDFLSKEPLFQMTRFSSIYIV